MKRLFTLLLIFALCFPCYASENKWHGTKPPPGSQIDWSHPLSKGLVGAWLMNEGGGRTVNNLASPLINTFSGTLNWQPTKKGKTLYFNGISGGGNTFINCGSILNMGGKKFSIASGFRPKSFASGVDPDYRDDIVGKDQDTNNGWYGLYVRSTGKVTIESRFTTAGRKSATSTSSTSLNNYTFATGIYDGINLKMYFNGVFEALTSVNEAMASNGNNFFIGKQNLTDSYRYQFDGHILFVYIFSRALTPSEIMSLYIDPYQFIKKPNWGLLKAAEAAGVFVPQTQVIWFN